MPFSVPGGTEDEIWLRIVNEVNEASNYISLGSDITDDGESYTFRVNTTNLGENIRKIQFIQFGDDDFCIDLCQINDASVDLGLTGSECNENVDENGDPDNDGCAVLTCDYGLDQISTEVQSPCTHDVYGWNDKSYRIYTVIIDICLDIGETIDSSSANTVFVVLENDELGLSTEPFQINGIGKDGDNIYSINTTNIGTVDKLRMIHFNNDDLCIQDISVDGFEVSKLPWLLSEYDCEFSDIGCNVITADFETNDLEIETIQDECPYAFPDTFTRNEDSCLFDTVNETIDKFASTTVGLIVIIASVIVGLICIGGCFWFVLCVVCAKKAVKDENSAAIEI